MGYTGLNGAVATMVFSTSSAYASPNNEASTPTRVSFSDNKDLYTVEGDYLGNLNRITTIEQVTNKDGKFSYIHTEINDYELAEEYAAIPAYAEKFADSSETTTYSVSEDNELVVNGEIITEDSIRPIALLAQDTGGVTSISHYYSTNDMTNYSFRTYSDIAFKFDHGIQLSPAGNHVAKDSIKRTNSYFYDAKSSIDAFETSVRFRLKCCIFCIGCNNNIFFFSKSSCSYCCRWCCCSFSNSCI